MTNKIETLRAICFTQEDLQNVVGIQDSQFTSVDIDFMVEFKKVFELGLPQLKKFITKLDEEGAALDPYSIQYYVDNLNNCALTEYVKEYAANKKYFRQSPDCMGCTGNVSRSCASTSAIGSDYYPTGCGLDTFVKLPPIVQNSLTNAVKQVENVFRSSIAGCLALDNTLPLVDKSPQYRYMEEPRGGMALSPAGNYLLKDSRAYDNVAESFSDIAGQVQSYLGSEDYRMYTSKKQYSPFTLAQNESTSTNMQVTVKVADKDEAKELAFDLMGDIFDSDERRKSEIVVPVENSNSKIYKLNTNTGQLGS